MEIISSFVTLLGGLAIFLVGIHQMSTGLEQLSSKRMQKGLAKVSNNRFISFGFGTFITSIMQSSTLVTVMTLSFLNAGLLSLFQGIAIILGANIGTTLTGLISSFATVDYAMYFSLFAFIGVLIEMFAKKSGLKKAGQIFIGFGLIFIGLSTAGDSFKTPEMNAFIGSIFESANNPILLIIISIIFTAIAHSSSLVVGLAIILASSGAVPVEYALYVVLGAEIGTTITGVTASLSGNANAKRLAFVQLVFNTIGTVIFTIILWIFNDKILNLLSNVPAGFQVSLFQIIFNVSTAFIALIFIKQFEKLSYVVIKDSEILNNTMELKYLNDNLLKTPSFALTALQKEISRMFDLTRENMVLGFQSINHHEIVNLNIVEQNEDTIDYLTNSISLYLVKLSNERLAYQDELEIGRIYHLINDLERIADHAYNFMKITQDMITLNTKFSSSASNEVQQMSDQVLLMYDLSADIYLNDNTKKLAELSSIESIVDKNKLEFETNHVSRLLSSECKIEHSKFFYDITSQLERIGDHLINIGYTTVNVVGDELEKEFKYSFKK